MGLLKEELELFERPADCKAELGSLQELALTH